MQSRDLLKVGESRKLALKLCVPLTGVFRSCAAKLLPIVSAVSFKEPSEEYFPSKAHFLECSYSIADVAFSAKLESSGLLDAVRSGKYESFACDIGPNCDTVRGYSPNGLPRAIPASPPISDEEYLERVCRNADWLRKEYSGYIQVENLNYFPTGAYERVCESEFLRRIIKVTGVAMLFDIGHAVVSAHYMDYGNPMDYILELPLESVREVHLSRAGTRGAIFEDLHEAPGESELSIVEQVRDRGAPIEYLTIEYYRDPDVLCGIYQTMARALLRISSSTLDRRI